MIGVLIRGEGTERYRRNGNGKMEAQTGAPLPQAEEYLGLPGAGSWRLQKYHGPTNMLILDLQPPEL